MINSHRLSERHWHISHAIALEVVLDKTDINELKKSIYYLRTISHRRDLGRHFLIYCETLEKHGNTIAHSSQTKQYYKSLLSIFDYYLRQCLKQDFNNFEVLCEVLCWASGLAKYYKTVLSSNRQEDSIAENDLRQELDDHLQTIKRLPMVPITSSLKSTSKVMDVEEGQILEAIATKKGSKNKVTYECLGQTFSEKESRNYDKIPLNQPINVEVKSLNEDGSINHIKFTENSP